MLMTLVMSKNLYLEGVNAWFAPNVNQDGIEEKACVDFLAPMIRRRLSPLGRAVLHSLKPLLGDKPDDNTAFVFASRWGDITLTEALLNELKDPEGISPNRFSTSVHNAIGGQFAIFEHFKGFITALSGGSSSLSAALIEAQALLSQFQTVYVCFYESRHPSVFSNSDDRGRTFAIALKFREAQKDEQSLQVKITPLNKEIAKKTISPQEALSAINFFKEDSEYWLERESIVQYRWYRK